MKVRKPSVRWVCVVGLALVLAITATASATSISQPSPGQQWWQGADMKVGRGYHTLTLLRDGRVLAVGGVPIQSVDRGAEIYDPATNAWRMTAPMVYQHANHSTALLNDGRVLVVGGYAQPLSAEIYSPSVNLWKATASLLTERNYGQTATVLNDGRVLVVGGCDFVKGCLIRAAEIYDPKTATWSPTGDLNVGRGWHTATLLPDGRVMVTGGYDGLYPINTTEIYNPSTGQWVMGAPMNDARAKQVITTLRNGTQLLYLVAGGVNGVGPYTGLASSEVFDPSSNQWTRVGDMSMPRAEFSAGMLPDGSVIVAGGESNEAFLNSAERFYPATMSWKPVGSIPQLAAELPMTVLSNGSLMVSGGTRSDIFHITSTATAIFKP